MERRTFFTGIGTATLTVLAVFPLMANTLKSSRHSSKGGILKNNQIQHMVIFDLHYEKGTELAIKFLADGQKILSNIPGVNNFQVFNQVSVKSDFTYGFSMVFDSGSDYESYSKHPDHHEFVENRWKKEVSRFQEIDFNSFKF